LTELARHYLPFAIVIPVSATESRDELSKLLPFTAAMTAGAGAAAYVCRDFTCRQPVGTASELRRELGVAES
jgi:uncharacterized protein YyaL (SSP411 family)